MNESTAPSATPKALQARFPVMRCALWSALAALGAGGGLAWWLGPMVVAEGVEPGRAQQAGLIAAGLVYLFQMLGIYLVGRADQRGLMAIVTGWFIGMGIRFLGSILGMVWLAREGWPVEPAAIGLVAAYLAGLAVEVAMVGRFIWPMRLPAKQE